MRTVGWRSPLGGPRYDGPIPGDDRDSSLEEWTEDRIQDDLEEIERGRGTVDPDEGLRADGGHVELREGEHRDDDNVHDLRNDQQGAIADEYFDDDLEEIHVGDHVRDRDDEDGATMLVVGTPIEQAEEYDLDEDRTIADLNPDYPAGDDVLEVVFPSRTDVSTRPLSRYAYPRSRLEIEARVHDLE